MAGFRQRAERRKSHIYLTQPGPYYVYEGGAFKGDKDHAEAAETYKFESILQPA